MSLYMQTSVCLVVAGCASLVFFDSERGRLSSIAWLAWVLTNVVACVGMALSTADRAVVAVAVIVTLAMLALIAAENVHDRWWRWRTPRATL